MMSNEYEAGGMYHTCRWCKWFQNGACINKALCPTDTIDILDIYAIAESGRLSEVIEEILNSCSTRKIERELTDKLLSYNLSKKRVDEVIQVFRDCLGEFLDFECKPELDRAVSKLYQEVQGKDAEGVEISDPTTFYCKEFW